VASLFQSGGEIAELDVRNHESELWAGIGRERHDGTIVRVIGSVFMLDRHLGPTRLEPGAPPDFAGGDEDLRLRRIAAEVRVWHPDFIVREDIERIGRKEDFDVGNSAALKLGYAPEFLGSTANEGYARGDADAGARLGRDFGYAHASLSMRLRRGPLEVIRRLDARWNHKWRPGHVLVLSAFGMGGTDVQRDFQVVVGGLNGLRAYPVQALAGTELVRLNAEQRWVLTRKPLGPGVARDGGILRRGARVGTGRGGHELVQRRGARRALRHAAQRAQSCVPGRHRVADQPDARRESRRRDHVRLEPGVLRRRGVALCAVPDRAADA
jgi:hypothetical protein